VSAGRKDHTGLFAVKASMNSHFTQENCTLTAKERILGRGYDRSLRRRVRELERSAQLDIGDLLTDRKRGWRIVALEKVSKEVPGALACGFKIGPVWLWRMAPNFTMHHVLLCVAVAIRRR
jgi:hypothetical protein